MCVCTVDWLDHGKTLREQGVTVEETLLLRRKYFFSDQNVDARDPVQLNLLYVQVSPYLFWLQFSSFTVYVRVYIRIPTLAAQTSVYISIMPRTAVAV